MIYQNDKQKTKKHQTARKAPALDLSTDFNEGISTFGLTMQFLGGVSSTSRSESGKTPKEVILTL